MRRRRGRWTAAAAMAAGLVAGGCPRDAAVDEHGTAGDPLRTLSVSLEAPQDAAWSADVSVRATLHNGTGATLEGVRLLLFLPQPLEPVAEAGRPTPEPVVASGEGTLLAFPLYGLAEGASVTVTPRVRIPPAAEAGAGGAFVLRAWAERAGERVGAEAADTLRVRPAARAAGSACAAAADPTATRHGVGPVRLGMAAEALRALCPEARDTAWSAEGLPERGLAVAVGGEPVLAVLVRDTVRRVVLAAPGVSTGAGVGVGATMADLRARYGRGCAGTGEGRVAVWFPNAPGISFVMDAPPDAGTAAEVPGEARVTTLLVHGETGDCPTDSAAPGER
jgi:hypothetical protein